MPTFTERTSLCIDPAQLAKVQKAAKRNSITVSSWIRMAIAEKLHRKGK